MSNIRIVINKSKIDKSGLCPLKLRISHLGIRKEVYLSQIKVNPKFWNSAKQEVTNDKMLTLRIKNELNNIQNELNRNYLLGKEITSEELISPLQTGISTKSNELVIDYIEEFFCNKSSLAYSTRKGYKTLVKVIQKLYPNLKFSSLSIEWMDKFAVDLESKYNLAPFTIWSRLKNIKSVINHAYSKNTIVKNPITGYKLTRLKANKAHLSIEQVNLLKKVILPANLQNTYNGFMFSIFTGLRFSDLATVTYKSISKDLKFSLNMRKTKTPLNSILNQSALRYININEKDKDLPLFNFLTKEDLKGTNDHISKKIESANALANKRLKQILKFARIEENYSFHCARHTFACIALQLGVDLMSLRDLIGHTDLKVTQEYLKVSDKLKRFSINKFDEL